MTRRVRSGWTAAACVVWAAFPLIVSAHAAVRTGTLQVRTRGTTGAVIGSADLRLLGEHRGTMTDENGLGQFDSLAAGTHIVRSQSPGFLDRRDTVVVEGDRVRRLDIVLAADPSVGSWVVDYVQRTRTPDSLEQVRRIARTVGVIEFDEGQAWLITAASGLAKGTTVSALMQEDPLRLKHLTVMGKVTVPPAGFADRVGIEGVSAPSYYRLRWSPPTERPEEDGPPALGVVGLLGGVALGAHHWRADLDHDGRPEILEICSGFEGLNLLVRLPKRGRSLWAAYHPYGFEVEESDCPPDSLEP